MCQGGVSSFFRHSYDAESENCAEHCGHLRAEPVCVGDRLVLRAVDADGARRGGLRADGRLIGGKKGKICGKKMNAVRQRLRWTDRATGGQGRCASVDYINTTMSIKSDPFDSIKEYCIRHYEVV